MAPTQNHMGFGLMLTQRFYEVHNFKVLY